MADQFLAVYAASRLHNYIMNLEGLPFDAATNPESEPIITTYLALHAVGFVMPLKTPSFLYLNHMKCLIQPIY